MHEENKLFSVSKELVSRQRLFEATEMLYNVYIIVQTRTKRLNINLSYNINHSTCVEDNEAIPAHVRPMLSLRSTEVGSLCLFTIVIYFHI